MESLSEKSNALDEPHHPRQPKRRTSFFFTHAKSTASSAACAESLAVDAAHTPPGAAAAATTTATAVLSLAEVSSGAGTADTVQTATNTHAVTTAHGASAALHTYTEPRLSLSTHPSTAAVPTRDSRTWHSSAIGHTICNDSRRSVDTHKSCTTHVSESAEEQFLRTLRSDASQRIAACFSSDSPLLIQAGAGSGKTQTMAMRIAVLLLRGVPARHLLGICFTRQAAETLRRRVESVLPAHLRSCAGALKLKTMHAFGLECLRQYGAIDAQTEVYDGAKQRALVRRVVREHAAHERDGDAVDELMDYINKTKTRAQLVDPANGAGSDAQAAYLYQLYQHALHVECHAVDFGDLLHMFLALLRPATSSVACVEVKNNHDTITNNNTETSINMNYNSVNNETSHCSDSRAVLCQSSGDNRVTENAMTTTLVSEACAALRRQFTHIVVDEFQDFNAVQMEILAQLGGEACRVTCVGDPNQCIYGWRGAVASGFVQWRQRFRQSVLHTLAVNYRSVPAIVSVLNRVVHTQQRAACQEKETTHTLTDKSAWVGSQSNGNTCVSVNNNNCSHYNSSNTTSTRDTQSTSTNVDGGECESHATRSRVMRRHAATTMATTADSHSAPTSPSGAVLLVQSPTDVDELRAVAHVIIDVLPALDAHYAHHRGSIAILCRTRRHVQAVCAALHARHVHTREMKAVVPEAIAPLRALLAYVRLCIDVDGAQSNEEVRVALTTAPHRLSARTAKSFLFSLDAVYRERNAAALTSREALLVQPPNRACVHGRVKQESGDGDGRNRDVHHGHRDRDGESVMLSAPSAVSYFTILCELVYYNFAPTHLPKLRLPRTGQKVVRHLVSTLTHAHSLLAQHEHSAKRSSLLSEGDVIDELLAHVVRAGGFDDLDDDHAHASKHAACNTTKHDTHDNTNRTDNDNDDDKETSNNDDSDSNRTSDRRSHTSHDPHHIHGAKHRRTLTAERPKAKRSCQSVCAAIAAEVAAEMSSHRSSTSHANGARAASDSEGQTMRDRTTPCNKKNDDNNSNNSNSNRARRRMQGWVNEAVEYTAAEEAALLAQTQHSLLRLLQRAYASVRHSFRLALTTQSEESVLHNGLNDDTAHMEDTESGAGVSGSSAGLMNVAKTENSLCTPDDLAHKSHMRTNNLSTATRTDTHIPYASTRQFNSSVHCSRRADMTPALLLRCVLDELTSVVPSDNFGSLQFATDGSGASDRDRQPTNTVTPTTHTRHELHDTVSGCVSPESAAACNEELHKEVVYRNSDDSVTVTTVHQAKGMEWPAVLVSGCWVGEFPVHKRSEEERRVFYVAVSRAQRHLVLLTALRESPAEDYLQGGTEGPVLERTPYIASFEKSAVKMVYDADTHAIRREP